jgi:hypothetical protein
MLGFIGIQELVFLLVFGLACCVPVGIVLVVFFVILRSQSNGNPTIQNNPLQEENDRLKRELAELKK